MKKEKLLELIKKFRQMPENYKLILAAILSFFVIMTFFLILVLFYGILGQKLF